MRVVIALALLMMVGSSSLGMEMTKNNKKMMIRMLKEDMVGLHDNNDHHHIPLKDYNNHPAFEPQDVTTTDDFDNNANTHGNDHHYIPRKDFKHPGQAQDTP